MENYDIVIVGAATSGAYFARRMAEKGYSVKVIEKLSAEKLGRRLDIFHVGKEDFKNFGLPEVAKGDLEWAFEFSDGYTASPTNKYPKHTHNKIVGMHMPEYIAKLNRWAEDAGATFEYSASFDDFLFGKDGKICGIKYTGEDGEKEIAARTVVDCSGTAAVARGRLPDGYGVENFALTPEDVFYVVLRYVRLVNDSDCPVVNIGWPFYKTWIAPQTDPHGAIIGIGACHSYEYAEEIYKDFEKNVQLPPYEFTHFERGTTPYTRPPYSFVADNFIVTGDAGCLTKPNNGEGVTSSMVQMVLAVDILDKALKKGDTSRAALWDINVQYNIKQGADFASTRAILTKAVSATMSEFEYFFKHDIIFSEKFLDSASSGPEIKIGIGDILHIAGGIIGGLVTGKISGNTLKQLLGGLSLGDKLKKHYLAFPTAPEGYEEWVKTADDLWKKVGKMA